MILLLIKLIIFLLLFFCFYRFRKKKMALNYMIFILIIFILFVYSVRNIDINSSYENDDNIRIEFFDLTKQSSIQKEYDISEIQYILQLSENKIYLFIPEFRYQTNYNGNYFTLKIMNKYYSFYDDGKVRTLNKGIYIPLFQNDSIYNAIEENF